MSYIAPTTKNEPDGVPHLLSQATPKLLGDTLGDGHGSNSAGLGAAHLAPHAEPLLRQVLGDLRSLTAARLPNDDQDLVVVHGLDEVLPQLEDWQPLTLLQDGQGCLTPVRCLIATKRGFLPLGEFRRRSHGVEIYSEVAIPRALGAHGVYPGLVDVSGNVVHLGLSLSLSQLSAFLGESTLSHGGSLQGTIWILEYSRITDFTTD